VNITLGVSPAIVGGILGAVGKLLDRLGHPFTDRSNLLAGGGHLLLAVATSSTSTAWRWRRCVSLGYSTRASSTRRSSGPRSNDHLEENVTALGVNPSDNDIERLEAPIGPSWLSEHSERHDP